jgi:hypothetical protein
MKLRRIAAAVTVASLAAVPASAQAAKLDAGAKLEPYVIKPSAMKVLKADFIKQIRSNYAMGQWAPMRMELSDKHLKLMGLPKASVLRKMKLNKLTMVNTAGQSKRLDDDPVLATYAGAGWFGIRPGALLLSITDTSIGWCTMAHVYGSPGSYKISTAGHCGNAGDKATVIAAVGNSNPVLLDFGSFSQSTGDAGVGNDYALISINAAYQSMVTPTMAFWGGPRGVFTKNGEVARYDFNNDNLLDPVVSTNPDPFLAQQLVHYGHGTGVGFPAGTPRSAVAISWNPNNYMFFGAISPGDSGSGSNTLTGDTIGANMEAAGINTHLYVSPLMDKGVGIMAGTRATKVGTPANGQIVPVPAPLPVVP